ncbi:MAG TPA: signal peptide peptidase SppA [Spirochaetes bacterium]|nr:signal peptide peptidase SppA [Spirochaetota bacterium]
MLDEDKRNPRNPRRGRAVDVIVRAVVTGIFILSVFMNIVFILVIVIMGSAMGPAKFDDLQKMGYRKVYLKDGPSDPKEADGELAVIELSGVITEFDTNNGFLGYSENPVSAVTGRLDIIKKDKNVKGVLFVIESPGGGITASDILYREIIKFKDETGLPVIALLKQVAASGAYYVASACDYILAHPTTVTGNIGVIMYQFNFTGLMDKYGVQYVAIKSSENKDLLSPFKGVDQKELAWMQDIVDQMLEQFIDAVHEGRSGLTRSEVKNLADGRLYAAIDALENGLIDEIGYFDDAVRVLSDRAGTARPGIIEYRKEKGLRDIFGWVALNVKPGTFMDILEREKNIRSYGMYYLWDGASLFTN